MTLAVPPGARGLILVAGGAQGSDRAVARCLLNSGFATYLVDVAGTDEVSVLAARLIAAVARLAADASIGDLPPAIGRLPLGCFAQGAAGSGALCAAAMHPGQFQAVVARQGSCVTLWAQGAHRERVCAGDDAVEQLAGLARRWFTLHLAPSDLDR